MSRDGARITFISTRSGTEIDPRFGTPVGTFLYGGTDVANADGSPVDDGLVAGGFYPSWVGTDALLVQDGNQGIFYKQFGAEEALWISGEGCPQYINCPPDQIPSIHEFASLSADGATLAYSLGPLDGSQNGMQLASTNGPPLAQPTDRCLAPGLEAMENGYNWAPDGSAIAYDGMTRNRAAVGISVMTVDLDAADCGLSTAQLLVPGGVQPDWGPTAADATGPGPGPSPSPAPTAPPAPGVGGFDGDVATTERIDQAEPTSAANDISRIRFADDRAAHVVLSRDDDFPDSLAGASLTRDAPLLLTAKATLTPSTGAEIARVLPAGGTVYLLGGTAAISQAVQDELTAAGFRVQRLAGPSRVETAVAVADEFRRLYPDAQHFAGVARAAGSAENPTAGWADSVTGGAISVGLLPILVTPSDALHPAVAAWLEADAPAGTVLFGGTAALSAAIEGAVPEPVRVAGADRTETAAEIARQLSAQETTGLRGYLVLDGFDLQGWAFGLAAAGLADDYDTPLLLVNADSVPAATAELVRGACEVDLLLIGSEAVINESVRGQLDALDPC